MYCSHCGKQMDAGACFCAVCGAAVLPTMYVRGPFPGQLVRPRYPRAIAGVCSGFALHYGWDLALVRVFMVLALLFSGGLAGLFYFAAWIIIPEAPYALPGNGVGGPGV
ncbi:MAG TPA: PspC domain-containing protein [Acidobacteriaceae bacterium]|nr:PspC domain-containing protein [Acidobacteriaceae bacterium]